MFTPAQVDEIAKQRDDALDLGITSVATDASMSGDGTGTSPLSVERPYPTSEQTRLDNVVAGEIQNSNNIQSLQNSLAPIATKVAGI